MSPANASRTVLPFRDDDFSAALAEAKRTKRPLFVDAWAPWCHSCLSLREYVLTDPSLAPIAKEFVWLAIDTEKEQNATFVARYPHTAVPTLWVIDPETAAPILKWTGGATAPELVTLLRSVTASPPAGVDIAREADAVHAFVLGNRAVAEGELGAGITRFREALAKARGPERPRIVSAYVAALYDAKDFTTCSAVATEEAPAMAGGTARAFTITVGLGCAREAKRPSDRDALLPRALLDAREGNTLADDRSGLYEEIVEAKKELGAPAEAKAIATEWATFLEGAAERAPTNEARAVFDAHRVLAYLAMGEPARALPMLARSEREFPVDYNPPARLARVYLELRRLDDADAAVTRALARVYGPRALRLGLLQADIAKARGDVAKERGALEGILARSADVPLTPAQRRTRDGIAARLAALAPAPASVPAPAPVRPPTR